MNPKQLKKAIKYNAKEEAEGDLTAAHRVKLIEFWQQNHDLLADGFGGPQTQKSIESAMNREAQSVLSAAETQFVNGLWLTWDGPETSQPRSYKEALDYFGCPETYKGSNKLDKDWYKKNIVELHGSDRLPGVPSKYYVKIHRKVEPYLREGLRRAMISAPDYVIHRLGGFNFRHIRYNPELSLSMHAFGAAFDTNPTQNSAKTFKKGKAPVAWSPEYYRIWPNGLPKGWIQAMSSVGFAWGNDWDEDGSTDDHTWLDAMHNEFIARDGHQFSV